MTIESFIYNRSLFPISFNNEEEMNTENIFLDAERWSQYSHPTKELEELQRETNPEQIKAYFSHKTFNASMLGRISNRQMEKIESHIHTPKIKFILKKKSLKLYPVRRPLGDTTGESTSSSKTSSKEIICKDEDHEVFQYLTF